MKNRHKITYFAKYLRHYFFDKSTAEYWLHLYLDAQNNHLQDHGLGGDSIVFIVGGYKGEFAYELASKFNPNIYIFEPVKDFCDEISARFQNNPKVRVFNQGLSNKTYMTDFFVNGAGSSIYETSETKNQVQMVDVCQFFTENKIGKIDLMSVNTEGSEYDILPRLLDSGLIKQIENIQIQFHLFDQPRYVQARSDIVRRILETHKTKYSFLYTWECFSNKTVSNAIAD